MSVRAVILAGGRGSRLDPLTKTLPKPLMPMMNATLIDHILALLSKAGFTEVVITLGYLGELISKELGAEKYGLTLLYTQEMYPRGTAGSVKDALEKYPTQEPFLVVAADLVTDIDFRVVFESFARRKATIGMVLKEVEDPRPYGVVVRDQIGDVRRFIEKPKTASYGTTINTGIYYLDAKVLDLVPSDVSFDFAHQLFPQWLLNGHTIMTMEVEGYWNDVGSIVQYQKAHVDVLDRKVDLVLFDAKHTISDQAHIDPTARIIGPVWIDAGVRIGPMAQIGPYAVIGARSVVGAGTMIARSVLGKGTVVGGECRLAGAVLARGVVLDRSVSVAQYAVLGDRSNIGWGAHVYAGLHVGVGEKVEPGTTLVARYY